MQVYPKRTALCWFCVLSSPVITMMNTSIELSHSLPENLTTRAVDRYFLTMNEGLFAKTATLFALDGILAPPLAPQIKGQAAIAAYLEKAARGICLKEFSRTHKFFYYHKTQVDVRGWVQTCFFEANVDWTFLLNLDETIALVQIKPLLSLEKLKQFHANQVACG